MVQNEIGVFENIQNGRQVVMTLSGK